MGKGSSCLVLFDIDGTLIRSAGPQHKEALIRGIKTVAGVLTTLDGVPTSGMLDGDLIRAAMRATGCTDSSIDPVIHQIMREGERVYSTICPDELASKVCPGVRELLSRLQEKDCVLGLVTGNVSGIGWKKMELAGLRQYFSVGAFAQDASTRAGVARIAASRAADCGLVNEECKITLIGDHQNDIHAAKANGFRSVAVATGFSPMAELALQEPDVLVNDLAEFDAAVLMR